MKLDIYRAEIIHAGLNKHKRKVMEGAYIAAEKNMNTASGRFKQSKVAAAITWVLKQSARSRISDEGRGRPPASAGRAQSPPVLARVSSPRPRLARTAPLDSGTRLLGLGDCLEFVLRFSAMLSKAASSVPARVAATGALRTSSHAADGGAKAFNQPLSPNYLTRAGGIASFMRLPVQDDTQGLDACLVGVPLDVGTSNRSGTRMGPRQIRTESVLLRPNNQATGAMPFESLNVADVGDVPMNIYNLPEACKHIRSHYSELVKDGCIPLTMGGDHTITYPILQAIKDRYGTVCLIHVDAHNDVSDTMLGAKITHGTPFRRAVEEDLIDPKATVQIGLRGSSYTVDAHAWQISKGFRIVQAHQCWHKSLEPLMEEVKAMMGDRPVYLSFDIDAIDPGFCPGTGTPEIGGLTPIQALEIIRGCRGLNLVGCDLVEVSPPYDFEGTTALTGANLLFEMLCVLPRVKYYDFK